MSKPRLNNIIPFSRSYRRPPRWNMGLPPKRQKPARLRGAFAFRRSVGIGLMIVGASILPKAMDSALAVKRSLTGGSAGCHVVSVLDGDTLTIWCSATGIERARLLGFDTPELFSPGCLSEFVAAQRATWALRWRIWTAAEVKLVKQGSDRYERALTSLFLDGRSVATEMIAGGHARAYSGGKRSGWCD